ncbi:MAG: glutamyl-tRNA reductase [Bacteroidota bacterium]
MLNVQLLNAKQLLAPSILPNDIAKSFFTIGIDYKQTSIQDRGLCSLDQNAQQALLSSIASEEDQGLLVLSTCNRTELYSVGINPYELKALMAQHSQASVEFITEHAWTLQGYSAMEHLMRVSSGIESYIIGDLQISNQVKKAWQQSKQHSTHPIMERWVNTSLKTSKRVRNETHISDGCATVSYASTQAIQKWCREQSLEQPKVLLLGIGEIGQSCAYNIIKHIPKAQLQLSNRSFSKAQEFAQVNGIEALSYEEKEAAIAQADVVIAATGAYSFILDAKSVNTAAAQLFLDLAVPNNIDPSIGQMDKKSLLDLDQIAQMTGETFAKRKAAIPQAESIVKEELLAFQEWLSRKQFSPLIHWLKQELNETKQAEIQRFQRKNPSKDIQAAEVVSQHLIHSLTAKLAKFINHNHQELAQELSNFQSKIQSQQ